MPTIALPPIRRSQLALFAGASGDHNLMHIDSDFAREHGAPDVFAHGMLGMAWLARAVSSWVLQHQIRELQVRFVDILKLGDAISFTGTVIRQSLGDTDTLIHVEIRASDATGTLKLSGLAILALPLNTDASVMA